VMKTFIPLIEQGDRQVIANVSSALASIGTDFGREHTSYSISKYGLNMLVCVPMQIIMLLKIILTTA
jgi:NAD(P)-dependent dehydrogenase (short-subunit alcohol dehydrogenase family)